jgi:hypothetical protein
VVEGKLLWPPRATVPAMTDEDEGIITPLRPMIAVVVFIVGIAVGVLLAAWFAPL